MAKILFDGFCTCGAKFEAAVRKPTRMTATVHPLTCRKCKGRFLVRIAVDESAPGRQYTHAVKMLEETADRTISDRVTAIGRRLLGDT